MRPKGGSTEEVHSEVRIRRKSRKKSRIKRKGSFCESKTKKSMYMLINMLKKQYHEMTEENLQIKTKIKKVRKERDKVAKEVDVMREIKEDGHMDSIENQERRKRMLLETEWKQKIKKKNEEIQRVISKLKVMRKEMKGENLRHLEKELKFYANLNRNIEKEIEQRKGNLCQFKEEIRRNLREKRDEIEEKEGEIGKLSQKLRELMEEKYSVKKDFNQLILDEEMKMVGSLKKPKKVKQLSKEEKLERVQLKDSIKTQIEYIQGKEEEHLKLFENDQEVVPLQGLHYTNKNEILLNIDCETEVDEDVLFYLKGGRNLELYLELEGIKKCVFMKNLSGALKGSVQKDKFKKEVFVKKLYEKRNGKLPKVLGKVVGDVMETVIMKRLETKPKRNKKIKINTRKKLVSSMDKIMVGYFKENLQYKIFAERGEGKEEGYLEKVKNVWKKLENVEFEEGEEGSDEAWVRYLLITKKGFSMEEASLIISSAFWNIKDSEEITVDDLKRYMKKYIAYLEKKQKKRQEEKEKKELEEAAVKIQSVFKGKKARKEIEEMKKKEVKEVKGEKEEFKEIIEEEEIEEIEEMEEVVEMEEIEEDIKEVKSEDEIDWEKEEEKAALIIQKKYKQKMAKRKVEQMKKEKKEQEDAAILIQKNFKRKQAKKILEQKKKEREEEEAAATFIQKKFKQKMANRKLEQGNSL